jgi:hypothetical protein
MSVASSKLRLPPPRGCSGLSGLFVGDGDCMAASLGLLAKECVIDLILLGLRRGGFAAGMYGPPAGHLELAFLGWLALTRPAQPDREPEPLIAS